MINHKEHIIKYFKSGIKDTKNFKIGIEHEKFLFDQKIDKRVDYSTVQKMFSALIEFAWEPLMEKQNIIGLQKQGKNITLEPGNQIELSGDKLNNIHEACAESHDYLFELQQVTKKLGLKIVSAGFDPISTLSEVPNNPKQRYEVMTRDMPNGGSLSLDMMYRTCGTQLNLDYKSEKDFIKKFKIINSLVPISIALFANSSIVEKKNSGFMSYRSKVWQETSRGGLPEIFFDNMNFEKYADFAIKLPLLFIQNDKEYFSGKIYPQNEEPDQDVLDELVEENSGKDISNSHHEETNAPKSRIFSSGLTFYCSGVDGKLQLSLTYNFGVYSYNEVDELWNRRQITNDNNPCIFSIGVIDSDGEITQASGLHKGLTFYYKTRVYQEVPYPLLLWESRVHEPRNSPVETVWLLCRFLHSRRSPL